MLSNLPPHDENKGWYRFKCPICNDYKVRAGFNFNDDFVIYNCWNCGVKESHHEDWDTMGKKMRKLLGYFGISNETIDQELGKKFFKNIGAQPAITRIQKEKVFNFNPPEVALPPDSYPVNPSDQNDIWQTVAVEYLASRGLSPASHPFYLSSDPTYRERIIIPFFKGGKVIYWQARHFDDDAKVRYLNPDIDRNTVIYGFDKLFDPNIKSMFWSEGVFDAISIDGGCLLGSSLSEEKVQLLSRFRKDHIFIVDKDQNGYSLGCKALSLGFKITCVEGTSEDANDSVKRFGKLFTIASLVKNTMEGVEAQLFLEMHCKDNTSKDKGTKKR